jgi:hypothetical protein
MEFKVFSIDPKTYRLLDMMSVNVNEGKAVVSLVYFDEERINVKIPDSRFQVPRLTATTPVPANLATPIASVVAALTKYQD